MAVRRATSGRPETPGASTPWLPISTRRTGRLMALSRSFDVSIADSDRSKTRKFRKVDEQQVVSLVLIYLLRLPGHRPLDAHQVGFRVDAGARPFARPAHADPHAERECAQLLELLGHLQR